LQSLEEKFVKVGPMSENPLEPSHWNLLEIDVGGQNWQGLSGPAN
jgi:hypothetical protein